MKTNPLKQGAITESSRGLGTITREMVSQRGAELALINGHEARTVPRAEWQQAKRELTGDPDPDPAQSLLASVPESARWDLSPGSVGHKAPESSSEDEDEDGRSDSARLVEAGSQEAGHDQMLQAAEAQRREHERA